MGAARRLVAGLLNVSCRRPGRLVRRVCELSTRQTTHMWGQLASGCIVCLRPPHPLCWFHAPHFSYILHTLVADVCCCCCCRCSCSAAPPQPGPRLKAGHVRCGGAAVGGLHPPLRRLPPPAAAAPALAAVVFVAGGVAVNSLCSLLPGSQLPCAPVRLLSTI